MLYTYISRRWLAETVLNLCWSIIYSRCVMRVETRSADFRDFARARAIYNDVYVQNALKMECENKTSRYYNCSKNTQHNNIHAACLFWCSNSACIYFWALIKYNYYGSIYFRCTSCRCCVWKINSMIAVHVGDRVCCAVSSVNNTHLKLHLIF